jgi:hypothetical protein
MVAKPIKKKNLYALFRIPLHFGHGKYSMLAFCAILDCAPLDSGNYSSPTRIHQIPRKTPRRPRR